MIRKTILAMALVGFSGAGIASAATTTPGTDGNKTPVAHHVRTAVVKAKVAKAGEPAPAGDMKPAATGDVKAVKEEGAKDTSKEGAKKVSKKHKAKTTEAAPATGTPAPSPAPSAEKPAPAPTPAK